MTGQFFIKYRLLLLITVLCATAFSLSRLPMLERNVDAAKNYPKTGEDYEFYKEYTDSLGTDANFILVGIESDNGIFDTAFLTNVDSLTEDCFDIPHIEDVKSITNIEDAYLTPFGLVSFPYLSADNFENDSSILVKDEQVLNRFVSSDLKSVVLVLEFIPSNEESWKIDVIENLEKAIAKYEFKEAHIMGQAYFEVVINRTSRKEMRRNLAIGLTILLLMLAWLFRSVWGVILPILVYIIAFINFLGCLTLLGYSLNMFSSLYPIIILLVTLSDVIHLMNRYEENLRAGQEKLAALKDAINQAGIAIFLTSFLMAIGFWTFATFPIENIANFGIAVGVGIMIVFVVTICLLPAFLVFANEQKLLSNSFYRNRWRSVADRIFKTVSGRSRLIEILTVIAIAMGLWSITQIDINRAYTNNWNDEHPFEMAADFFEKNKFGYRPYEIAIIPTEGKTLSDLGVLKEIEKLHDHLKELPFVHNAYSPVSYFKSFHRIMDADHETYSLPEDQETLDYEEAAVIDETDFEYSQIMNEGKTIGKISTRIAGLGSEETLQQNEEIKDWISQNIDASLVTFRITGKTFMNDIANHFNVKYILSGLSFSFVIIGLILFLFFRRFKMVILIMVVNLLPIFITLTLMYILGINMTLERSVVFNMVFILALDDTIHYIIHYRQIRKEGMASQNAIQSMLSETGKAMMLTTILVVCAFGGLILSSGVMARDLGILLCCTSIGSLLTDFYLAPKMLLMLERNTVKK